MSKIPFTVRTLRNVTNSKGPPLTRESNTALTLNVHPSNGRIHVVLEFAQTVKVKNLTYKNGGAAFLTVYGGSTEAYNKLAAMAPADDPTSIVETLPALVPETQLCSLAQTATPQP